MRCLHPGAWFLLAAVLLGSCAKPPPEQALREALTELQQGIEAREADAVESYLAQDFVGPEGLDRAGARRLAALQMMRHDRVRLAFGPFDLQLKDRHATVRFTAAAVGDSGTLLPDAAQVYDVETGWRLEGDEWRMTSATWQPRL